MLAGGQSRRMGTDKAGLEIVSREHGVTTISRMVLRALGQIFSEVLVIGGEPLPGEGWRQCADLFPGGGALGGIYTALQEARHEYVFVAACDMPFLAPATAAALLELAGGHDVTVPVLDGRAQTLHAVYRKTCAAPALALLESGRRRIVDFYPGVDVREVPAAEFARLDPGGQSSRNINTPEDLARARAEIDPR